MICALAVRLVWVCCVSGVRLFRNWSGLFLIVFCCCLAAGRIRGFTISLCLNAGTTIQRLTLFLNVLYFSACYGYKRSTQSYLAAIDLGWAGLHVAFDLGPHSAGACSLGWSIGLISPRRYMWLVYMRYVYWRICYIYDVYVVWSVLLCSMISAALLNTVFTAACKFSHSGNSLKV